MTAVSTKGHGRRRVALNTLTMESKPTVASGVSFQEPFADGSLWIVTVEGVPTSRVSGAVVTLLSSMDGLSAIRDLHERLAPDEHEDQFLALVERFHKNGLLEGAERKNPGRFVFRAPLTVQIATLRAPSMFGTLDRVVRPFPGAAGLIVLASIVVLGLIATVVQIPDVVRLLVSPVPLLGLVILSLALGLLTLIHESAHGLSLTRFGGRPRRAGFMLFYLTPAFFVDVTDGWRLENRWQRVTIALAGPAVHAVFGSGFAAVALLTTNPDLRQLLLLLAIACYSVVLVNLVPFVRFDGYIALMSALDEPNLRERTKQDGLNWFARLLYGGHATPKRLNRGWSVPFGIASVLAPVCLVVFAVLRISGSLAGSGPLTGLIVLGVEIAVSVIGLVILARGLRAAWRNGASKVRFVLVNIAVVAITAIAGSMILIPTFTTTGYTTGNGNSILVVSGVGADISIPDGAHVSLLTNGVMGNISVGSGTFEGQALEPVYVPLQALFPIKVSGVEVPASVLGTVHPDTDFRHIPLSGKARVDLGVMNLWQALWASAVEQPLADLLSR